MQQSGLKEYLKHITDDESLTLDERIDEVINALQELMPEHEDEQHENEITAYTVLIDMLKHADTDHQYDTAYLQLCALKAEALVDNKSYRALKEVARDVLHLMTDEVTTAEAYSETIPRIADALADTVYYHDLYEIVLRFISAVVRQGAKDIDIREEAETLLRLQTVLPDIEWYSDLLTSDVRQAIAALFTSLELVNIIANPGLGHLRKDPVEYSVDWERIYYDVEDELDRILADTQRGMGFCFKYWSVKHDLLKKKYGIEWRSPSQMNPRVMFD